MFIHEICLIRLYRADAHTFTVASICSDGEQVVSVNGLGSINCDVRVVGAWQTISLIGSALHSRVYYNLIEIV